MPYALPDQAVDRLLDDCVSMHDAAVQQQLQLNLYDDAPYVSQGDLTELTLLNGLLDILRVRPSVQVRTLAGFVLDNVIDAHVFAEHGTDESSTDDPAVRARLRDGKNRVARSVGFANYFDLYCATRETTAGAARAAARVALRSSEREWRALSARNALHGVTFDRFEQWYQAVLGRYDGLLGADLLIDAVGQQMERSYGPPLTERLTVQVSEDAPVTYACSILNRGAGYLVSAPVGGVEQFKAAFHGLGHAIYSLLPAAGAWVDLPVNLDQTEALAFLAQASLFDGPPAAVVSRVDTDSLRELREAMRLVEVYFRRVYAARTIAEDDWYRAEPSTDRAAGRLSELTCTVTGLSPVGDPELHVDWRPLCLEFLRAYEISEAMLETAIDKSGIHVARTEEGRVHVA